MNKPTESKPPSQAQHNRCQSKQAMGEVRVSMTTLYYPSSSPNHHLCVSPRPDSHMFPPTLSSERLRMILGHRRRKPLHDLTIKALLDLPTLRFDFFDVRVDVR